MECFTKGEIKFAVQKQYKLSNFSISGYEYLANVFKDDLGFNENFMPIIVITN